MLPVTAVVAVALLPFFRPPLDGFMDDCILALIFVAMALGLNLIVGFAGLLDLGYVAFYAFGAMAVGWWASDHFAGVNGDKGIHVGVSAFAESLPGIHLNFLLLLIGAIIVCAIAGAVIGLPTLRLRGDYIAIVTLAFGEIVGRFMQNGDEIKISATTRSPTAASRSLRWTSSTPVPRSSSTRPSTSGRSTGRCWRSCSSCCS